MFCRNDSVCGLLENRRRIQLHSQLYCICVQITYLLADWFYRVMLLNINLLHKGFRSCVLSRQHFFNLCKTGISHFFTKTINRTLSTVTYLCDFKHRLIGCFLWMIVKVICNSIFRFGQRWLPKPDCSKNIKRRICGYRNFRHSDLPITYINFILYRCIAFVKRISINCRSAKL